MTTSGKGTSKIDYFRDKAVTVVAEQTPPIRSLKTSGSMSAIVNYTICIKCLLRQNMSLDY